MHSTVLADLSPLGLMAVDGADAASFLQGQLSNDLSEVTSTRSQFSAWCNAKGRVLALMRVFKRADTYYLQLPRDILEATLKRLRLYVLRSQAQLADISDAQVQFGLSGATAPALLARLLDMPSPTLADSVATVPARGTHAPVSVLTLPGVLPRFALITDPETAQDLWRQCAGAASPAGGDAWSLLDIRAGLPSIHSATQDLFIPQMLNLDLIGAVSFTKGCYPGQEIVARAHHLGAVKRRMYHACASSSTLPAPGAALYSAASGQSVGHVVEAVAGPEGNMELLAVIPTEDAAGQHIRLHDTHGPTLHFKTLPYTRPE